MGVQSWNGETVDSVEPVFYYEVKEFISSNISISFQPS